jgi:hypothetical protein
MARDKNNLLFEQIIVYTPPFDTYKSTTDFIMSNPLFGTQHDLRFSQLGIEK